MNEDALGSQRCPLLANGFLFRVTYTVWYFAWTYLSYMPGMACTCHVWLLRWPRGALDAILDLQRDCRSRTRLPDLGCDCRSRTRFPDLVLDFHYGGWKGHWTRFQISDAISDFGRDFLTSDSIFQFPISDIVCDSTISDAITDLGSRTPFSHLVWSRIPISSMVGVNTVCIAHVLNISHMFT